MAARQRTLSPQFDALFRQYRGQEVDHTVLAFAGEIVVDDQEVLSAMELGADIEITVRGIITGNAFKVKDGITGVVTMKSETVALANGSVAIVKGSAAAKAAKAAERNHDDAFDTPLNEDGRPIDLPPTKTRRPRGAAAIIHDEAEVEREAAQAEADARNARVLAGDDEDEGIPDLEAEVDPA